jgi:putative serine protease PepD
MTSIRVTAEDRSYLFGPGAEVLIGRSDTADVVLRSPAVSRRHARLMHTGDTWYLVDDDSVTGIWVDGDRVDSMPVAGPVTAFLGDPQGNAAISLEPVADPAGRPADAAAAAAQGTAHTLPASPAPSATPAGPPVTGPAPAGPPAPVLVTRLGREQRIFPVGMTVRVGRDPSLELVSTNPLVSRQCHGLIVSDRGGATYTDLSRRGTFLDGKPLRGPLRITQSVLLRLGDPATGEELGITPPLSTAQLARNRGRRLLGSRMRVGTLAAVAVVAAAALAVGLVMSLSPAEPGKTGSAALGTASLRRAEAATARLLIGSPTSYTGWGSGTLISSDGLILTNAHVAQPQAPGAAVATGVPASQLEPNPPFLTVELTTGRSLTVVPRYRARPVAVDGYLDLAVVQIYATSSGQPVNPASLHLPHLTLGNDAALQLAQPVTVLGYPGVADSDSISVTSGVISTFVPDPLRHVADPRFELETTARVAHGNSGGAAINNAGQLIGVPSLAIAGEGSDVSWRLRSVAEAAPLLAAARGHTTYQSRVLVQLSGAEQVTGSGIGSTAQAACAGNRALAAVPPAAVFAVGFTGFANGLDIAMLISLPDGSAVTAASGGLPQTAVTAGSGCFTYDLTAAQLGLTALPAGGYQVQLLAGPNLAPVAGPASLAIGAAATPPAAKTPAAPTPTASKQQGTG